MARRRRPARVRVRRRPRAFGVEGLEGRQMLAASVAVGSDVGAASTPLVRLVDAESGEVQASVLAFEAGFRGGVRVAMGRVTGNAAADVVVASGSGRVAEVKVFRPVTSGATTTLTQVLSFRPFGDSYVGGCEVAVGNVDGIGAEDIIVSKSREGGDVKVFLVTNSGGTTSVALHSTIAKPFGAGYSGGSSVGVADVGEFRNGALVKNLSDNKVEILVGSGAGIPAQVRVYDISRPGSPRLADTITPAFNAALGRPFTGGVAVTSGRYAASGVADAIDDIVVLAGRGGSGAAQMIVYDGRVSPAANAVLRSFAPYGAAQRPNAAVFAAAVDVDGNGQVDRFLVTQGDPGGPAGIANVSIAGIKASAVTNLTGPLRIATARTVFATQTINGTVATPSPTAGVPDGASRPMEIREIVTGTGAVAATWDTATVQYTGVRADGFVFDTSRQADRGPFTLTLGTGQVIPGWEAGLVGMKVGGRRLLVIPPELAYGDAGSPPNIRAGDTLFFDVELVSVVANRAATIGGTSTGAVTEDGSPATAGATLTVTDPDDTASTPAPFRQSVFAVPAAAALAGTYGAFTFNATTGAWGYTLDNTKPATQALTAGQTVTDTLAVTSRDGTASRMITVTVTGAGEVPTTIALSASSVAENAAVGTAVGTLSTTDSDSVAPFTYTLVSGEGAADNASFSIDGAVLKTGAAFDFETKTSYSVRIRSADSGGLSVEKTFTITVTNVDEAPTDIALSATTVVENSDIGTTVGTLSTTDPDSAPPFTYTLVSGDGDADNASFTIAGAVLKTVATFDREAQASRSVRVRSTDQTGLWFEKVFTITITNVNEAPTDIALSAAVVADGAAPGTTVGTLSTTDADVGDTFTYELVTGEGDTGNASFAIDGAVLKTALAVDFETQTSYSIRVRSTDAGSLSFEKTFTITVTNANEAPTDIALSAATVAEDAAPGTTVGTLSTTDVDAGDTFTYELVTGEGATGNALFTIDGAVLKTAAAFDFETQTSYSIRVRSTDSGSLSVVKTFTITVTNANEAPTDIALSATTVAENSGIGTTVGTLSTTDVDARDTFTYELVTGDGDTGNASFTIDGTVLKTAAVFDFETQSSYSVRVKSTDSGGLSVEKTFTITVTNVDEAPTSIALSATTITDGSASGTTVGTLSTTDPDVGDTVDYELVTGDGDTDNGSFTIAAGGVLKTAAAVDFGTQSSYSVRVRSTDSGSLSVEKTFTITVNRVATITGDTTGAVSADAETATASGTLTVFDPDDGQSVFSPLGALVDEEVNPNLYGSRGTYGDFTFDAATGAWTYALRSNDVATVVLTSDRTVTDSLTVTSLDGTASETITVSITGFTMQTVTGYVNTPSPSEAAPAGSESTIRYRDFSVGTGDVAAVGKVIDAYYIGLLSNGSIFQARWPFGTPVPPLTALLDTSSPYSDLTALIPGWVFGIPGMQVGGIRVLVIPAELAYGDAGSPGAGIPGGETLTFIVGLEGVWDLPAP